MESSVPWAKPEEVNKGWLAKLVDHIYETAGCSEALTKNVIAEMLMDVLLFDKKQHDYGSDNIGAFGELGVLVRANDKLARLRNLLYNRPDEPSNESVRDSWQDLSVYGVIARIVRRGDWK